MKNPAHLVALAAGLVLPMHVTPSRGQTPICQFPGCNPTASDDFAENTAGGTGALLHVVPFGTAETCFQGCDNTAFGYFALQNTTHGSFNTASGTWALTSNTTGGSNTAIGYSALLSNTTGGNNTATGRSALGGNTTGSANTASGARALQFNNIGNNNTAVGFNALSGSSGNKNIAIGYKAGFALTSGNNNIYLGSQGGESSEFQTMRLGKAQTRTFIAGIADATVTEAAVMIDTTTGQLGIATSSARYKQDIAPMGTRSDKVLELRPVTFAYKDDAQHVKHYGLIAEEVAAVYPELVTQTATGEVQTVKYQELIPMLLNELQRQRQDFQQALQNQQKELAELRALVGQGRAKVVLGGAVE